MNHWSDYIIEDWGCKCVAEAPWWITAAETCELALALFRLGRYQEALVELQSAASGENPDAVILDHLGDTYHQLDQPQKARDAWQRAVKAFHKEGENEKAAKVEKKITSSSKQENKSP